MSGRKSTTRGKLKVASQEERLQIRIYLENPPEILDEPTKEIIHDQLDIKVGQFTEEKLDTVQKKLKVEKLQVLMNYPLKYGRQQNILLWLCNAVYKQNTIEKWTKRCILLVSKNGDLGITKNYRGIIHTAIVAMVYHAQLLSCIQPEVEKILKKNQSCFQRNRSTISQIVTLYWTIKGVHAKILRQHSHS